MGSPTHVEILAAVLKCECGHETLLEEGRRPLVANSYIGSPEQRCEGCGRVWWCPATVDCKPVEVDRG